MKSTWIKLVGRLFQVIIEFGESFGLGRLSMCVSVVLVQNHVS